MKRFVWAVTSYMTLILATIFSLICLVMILSIRLDQQAAKEIQTLQKMEQDLNHRTILLKQGRYMISRQVGVTPY